MTGAVEDQYRVKVDSAIFSKLERDAVIGVDDGERFCLGVQVKIDVFEDGLYQFHFNAPFYFKNVVDPAPGRVYNIPQNKRNVYLISCHK